MTLGFSVQALVPHARGGATLRMCLTRIAQADWLRSNLDLATRAAAFDAHPDAVLTRPGSEDAGREVAALVGVDGGFAQADDERERRAAPFYAAALASYATGDRSAQLEPT